MAKSKRNKPADIAAKNARRRKRRLASGSSASSDSSHRAGLAATSLSPQERRELAQRVNAWQFLLNYLNYVRDGGFDVPLDQFGPRHPDETAEQAELRLTVARKTKEVQALAGNWAELCVEVLSWIPLDTADAVVANIAEVGGNWLTTSKHIPDRDEWIAGARPLLGVLCPAEHWLDALNVLDQLGTMGISPDEAAPLVETAARAKPEASIDRKSVV